MYAGRTVGSHPPGGRSAFVELFLASTPFSADPSHSFQNAPGSGSLKDASSEVSRSRASTGMGMTLLKLCG